MQGTLNEIDIRSILQLIKLGQRTGELLIEADQTSLGEASLLYSSATEKIDSPGIFWLVFFVNGEIVYATQSQNRGCRRLRDYLFRYQVNIVPEDLEKIQRISHNEAEYAYLWQLIKQNRLTPDQGKSIIQQMVRETLFDLLSLRQGAFVFEMGLALDPLLISIEIEPLVREMMQEVQQWKQLHPYFESPQQALTIAAPQQLQNTLPQKAYEQLLHWADGKTSLRRLSRRLQRNLGTLARGLYPYVERGWLHPVMTISPSISKTKKPSTEAKSRNSPHVVCIDDDLSVSKTVESILKKNGYQISLITDPLPGLSLIFELKPDVILCDIAMPKLDGYEICAMLRHSKVFKYTPIMMLTGKEGFIDRIRARMVGATDYLTKPFGEQELLLLIEKYVTPKMRSRSH
ncbi:response regulator [Crocosphaera sp.]|uniref:response regulator n=1 Tax=Crocosphaera sp. TaxID=2729996 RepID=UPI0026274B45|nr:response regulator [Crocosphaera sp.]MDJ0580131.1 response regulator [Crocosphaera sp.]